MKNRPGGLPNTVEKYYILLLLIIILIIFLLFVQNHDCFARSAGNRSAPALAIPAGVEAVVCADTFTGDECLQFGQTQAGWQVGGDWMRCDWLI